MVCSVTSEYTKNWMPFLSPFGGLEPELIVSRLARITTELPLLQQQQQKNINNNNKINYNNNSVKGIRP
ncbi:hypothetical protein SK128_016995 [Halocaridina rubra]|uniref:Uncharacterized protein n=1 Tax=Halocaridina rubra TaxID=373956 RepID=A0AAN9AHM4_HALRR